MLSSEGTFELKFLCPARSVIVNPGIIFWEVFLCTGRKFPSTALTIKLDHRKLLHYSLQKKSNLDFLFHGIPTFRNCLLSSNLIISYKEELWPKKNKKHFSFLLMCWLYILCVRLWHITDVKQYILIFNWFYLFYSSFTLKSDKNSVYIILKYLVYFTKWYIFCYLYCN